MSDETHAALEQAIRNHMLDENEGAYLTAFYVVAAGACVDSSKHTAYMYACSEGGPHEWLGLLWMGERKARGMVGE